MELTVQFLIRRQQMDEKPMLAYLDTHDLLNKVLKVLLVLFYTLAITILKYRIVVSDVNDFNLIKFWCYLIYYKSKLLSKPLKLRTWII